MVNEAGPRERLEARLGDLAEKFPGSSKEPARGGPVETTRTLLAAQNFRFSDINTAANSVPPVQTIE